MKIGDMYRCKKDLRFGNHNTCYFKEGKQYQVKGDSEMKSFVVFIDDGGFDHNLNMITLLEFFEKVEETKNYYVARIIKDQIYYLMNATGIYSKTDSHKDITREWSTKYDMSKLLHFKDKAFAEKIATSVKDGLVVDISDYKFQSEDPERENDEVVAEGLTFPDHPIVPPVMSLQNRIDASMEMLKKNEVEEDTVKYNLGSSTPVVDMKIKKSRPTTDEQLNEIMMEWIQEKS